MFSSMCAWTSSSSLIFLKVAALLPSSFALTFSKRVSTLRWSVFNSSIASGEPSANIPFTASTAEAMSPLPSDRELLFADVDLALLDDVDFLFEEDCAREPADFDAEDLPVDAGFAA